MCLYASTEYFSCIKASGNEILFPVFTSCLLTGSLSNDDGNGKENGFRKYNFISFALLRDYFNSLNFYKNGELSRNQIDRSGVQVRKKMKNSPSCVHVLHKTLNVVISRCCFAEDSKEMYQNVKRTCRAIVVAH